ncbi:hypothetical protein FPOAC2_03155 [Fusarium poae]|jgi:hypothetical protein
MLDEYKGKPFAPDSWVRVFDKLLLFSPSSIFPPLSIFIFCGVDRRFLELHCQLAFSLAAHPYQLPVIDKHTQSTLVAFRHQSHRQDEKGKKDDQSIARTRPLASLLGLN